MEALQESALNPVLKQVLDPLSSFYGDPNTVEVRMNRPNEVITDRRGQGLQKHTAADLPLGAVEEICHALSNDQGVEFHPERNPKLSCILPDGRHRFECLVGPSVRSRLSLAIRCKHPFTPNWRQVGADKKVKEWLLGQVAGGANMIISGATNTGKTTLLNKLLATIPDDRRVVAVEDTPELTLERFWNGVSLLAAREEGRSSQATGMVSWRELYDHMMRITPDHIVFGEISTTNSTAALAALNSGVTGFMCTIHAESPLQAIRRKFDQNIAWSGNPMPRVPEFLQELVDVVIQIKRDNKGARRITDIYQPRLDRWVMQGQVFTGEI